MTKLPGAAFLAHAAHRRVRRQLVSHPQDQNILRSIPQYLIRYLDDYIARIILFTSIKEKENFVNGSEEERGNASARIAARGPSCPDLPDAPTQEEDPVMARAARILTNLGFCGHYMHFHRGGRSGRAPILCLLEKNGGTMSQQALGMSFDLKAGSLSEILSKMEASGLITRTRDPQDRRQLTVCLTEAGAEAARLETEARIRFRTRAFSNLTPEEQEQLADLLDRVRARWEEL